MVGNDVVSDVGGAKECGMRGILVRTGKYRSMTGSASLIGTHTLKPIPVLVTSKRYILLLRFITKFPHVM